MKVRGNSYGILFQWTLQKIAFFGSEAFYSLIVWFKTKQIYNKEYIGCTLHEYISNLYTMGLIVEIARKIVTLFFELSCRRLYI